MKAANSRELVGYYIPDVTPFQYFCLIQRAVYIQYKLRRKAGHEAVYLMVFTQSYLTKGHLPWAYG